MICWTDSHCHLDAAEFDADRDAVCARALAAGVFRQLLPAIDIESCRAILALHDRDAALLPAFGLHPMYLERHDDAALLRLRELLDEFRPLAVGECGLDFFVEHLDRERQMQVFAAQIELAVEHGLPLVIHARRAVDAVIALLRKYRPQGGVIHSYGGSAEQARQLYALGFALGIGGPVTYERAQRLRQLVADMPIEFLLLETDAPDQPSCSLRGQRHEPADLLRVAEVIAELRGISLAELAGATTNNFERIFRFANWRAVNTKPALHA